MPPNAQDFQIELEKVFAQARRQGKIDIDLKSGDLHRRVGGYPDHNHRMPVCCEVMKRNMKPRDRILREPPKGQGATLIIKYKFPR